jgi:hypothetical protein
MRPYVVIVGAGFGGLSAAEGLKGSPLRSRLAIREIFICFSRFYIRRRRPLFRRVILRGQSGRSSPSRRTFASW